METRRALADVWIRDARDVFVLPRAPALSLFLRRICVAFVSLVGLSQAPAGANVLGPTIVVDAATGQVLQADRAGHPWFPASLTKMMTAYVSLRAVRDGRMTMDTAMRVSQRAARAAPSKMHFRPGTMVTLDNALKMMMVRSANDVSITIAEGVGGSIEGFVRLMNAEAQRLGMSATRFANPHGLPAPGQISSARDMAVLARAMMREFPEHAMLWQLPAIRLGNRVIRNTNHLIGRYPGANGFKTGFICASGFNVVATASRGGRQLITVVMGATSARLRAEHAAGLFERGFSSGGTGTTLDAIRNETHLSPGNIREQACRRRGRGPVFIDAGEEFDSEPFSPLADDPGSLSFAQIYAGAGSRGTRRAPTLTALTSTSGGAVQSLLGPYRPAMEPVPVFIGGGRPAPARAVAAREPAPATAAVAATAAAAAALAAPGAIARQGSATTMVTPNRAPGAIAAIPPGPQTARPGAIAPRTAPAPAAPAAAGQGPMTLQGAALQPSDTPAARARPASRAATARPATARPANARVATPPRATQNRPARPPTPSARPRPAT